MDLLRDVAVALIATWILILALFVLLRPRGTSFASAVRLLPDMAVLFRGLAGDKRLPVHVRWRPMVWVGWASVPFTYPVVGASDEVVLALWVIRSTVRRAGRATVERHWKGTPEGLQFLIRASRTA